MLALKTLGNLLKTVIRLLTDPHLFYKRSIGSSSTLGFPDLGKCEEIDIGRKPFPVRISGIGDTAPQPSLQTPTIGLSWIRSPTHENPLHSGTCRIQSDNKLNKCQGRRSA